MFRNATLVSGERAHVGIAAGLIAAVIPATEPAPSAAEDIDLSGAMLVPGFVEGHIHLDTSFYGDAWKPHLPCTNGFDVRERVAFQMQNIANAAPMDQRARNQLDLCIAHGSTSMRSHVMIDADVGLRHLETILAVREEYAGLIDVELVAFPQSGILASPGTAELMDEAIALGCDLVGGLDPGSFDRDIEGHLSAVFSIA
ncbi:MAG: amidohydrolase family protein, partial [Alphaproteobacteria bacterium]|nr:amidohydrolase family protein [Alphaproteobacteria bacterium]